jgi:hypothetical protein
MICNSMKPHAANIEIGCRRQESAGTLIEIMFSSTILCLLVIAIMSAHLVGLREDQWVESKGGASDSSRKILNQLPTDIKGSKMWFIGNMDASGTNFVIATNTAIGTALKLCQTTNGSAFKLYYFDLANSNNSDGHLMYNATNSIWSPVLITSNLVNWLGGGYTFNVEDFSGNMATNYGSSKGYKQVIHTTLQFCLFQYPLTQVGTNGLYDFYKIEFRATPHLPE